MSKGHCKTAGAVIVTSSVRNMCQDHLLLQLHQGLGVRLRTFFIKTFQVWLIVINLFSQTRMEPRCLFSGEKSLVQTYSRPSCYDWKKPCFFNPGNSLLNVTEEKSMTNILKMGKVEEGGWKWWRGLFVMHTVFFSSSVSGWEWWRGLVVVDVSVFCKELILTQCQEETSWLYIHTPPRKLLIIAQLSPSKRGRTKQTLCVKSSVDRQSCDFCFTFFFYLFPLSTPFNLVLTPGAPCCSKPQCMVFK